MDVFFRGGPGGFFQVGSENRIGPISWVGEGKVSPRKGQTLTRLPKNAKNRRLSILQNNYSAIYVDFSPSRKGGVLFRKKALRAWEIQKAGRVGRGWSFERAEIGFAPRESHPNGCIRKCCDAGRAWPCWFGALWIWMGPGLLRHCAVGKIHPETEGLTPVHGSRRFRAEKNFLHHLKN